MVERDEDDNELLIRRRTGRILFGFEAVAQTMLSAGSYSGHHLARISEGLQTVVDGGRSYTNSHYRELLGTLAICCPNARILLC